MDTMFERQDAVVGELSASVDRLKETALAIGDELRDQAPLIDRLDSRVGHTTEETRAATRRVDYVRLAGSKSP